MVKESLKGKQIVISGVFEKYTRKELKKIISEGGGKASSSISKNTSFILAGDKMGPSKKEKANELNIEMIGEKDFIKRFLEAVVTLVPPSTVSVSPGVRPVVPESSATVVSNSKTNGVKINILELGLEQIIFSDMLGLYDEDEINEIKEELASKGSYSDEYMEFYKDDDSETIDCTLITGSFEIIDHINNMKICEYDKYIMIVKDAWAGENGEGDEVGYISFEALYDVDNPSTLKGGEYDKKSSMNENELAEFYELSENESIMMDCKYQDFYFVKTSEYNEKGWIEKWLSQDYGHNK